MGCLGMRVGELIRPASRDRRYSCTFRRQASISALHPATVLGTYLKEIIKLLAKGVGRYQEVRNLPFVVSRHPSVGKNVPNHPHRWSHKE